jgi:cardiolipin synthase
MTQLLTVANVLTVIRLGLIPFFAVSTVYENFKTALVIFVVAGITDLLDGLAARYFHQRTLLGTILDPMADKLLLVTAFVILTLPGQGYDPIPFWLTAIVISRDAFIILGALTIFITTGFRGFRPSLPGKVSTLVQLTTIAAVLAANAWGGMTDYLRWLYYLTFAITLFSGIHYIYHAARLVESEE